MQSGCSGLYHIRYLILAWITTSTHYIELKETKYNAILPHPQSNCEHSSNHIYKIIIKDCHSPLSSQQSSRIESTAFLFMPICLQFDLSLIILRVTCNTLWSCPDDWSTSGAQLSLSASNISLNLFDAASYSPASINSHRIHRAAQSSFLSAPHQCPSSSVRSATLWFYCAADSFFLFFRLRLLTAETQSSQRREIHLITVSEKDCIFAS